MNKKVKKIIFYISLVVFVASLSITIVLCVNNSNKKGEVSSVISEAKTNESSVNIIEELPDNPINFKKLQKTNEDIYAWIKIPNTKIDYPIVQSYTEADDFYLNHNIKKQYDTNGSIYTEKQNSKQFDDPNTLIYGHNMLDGSMFQNLHKFRDKKFFDKNKYIYIYTPGHILKYKIVSAYKGDNKHILNCYDFSNEDVYADYLEQVKNPNSLIVNKREFPLTTNDKIITLSTCIGNEKEYRYLVQGVLVDDTATKW